MNNKMPARARRVVSNDAFNVAYQDTDNRGIIGSVLRHYSKVLTRDELEACGMQAIWKCLQYHDPERGQKFTTSLFRFTRWECRCEIRKKFGRRKERDDSYHLPSFARYLDSMVELPPDDRLSHIKECMQKMPHWRSRLLEEYFIDGKTLEQISSNPFRSLSKEATRQQIDKAISQLKQISRDSLSTRCK